MHVLALKPKLVQIEMNMDKDKQEITNDSYRELVETHVIQQVVDF